MTYELASLASALTGEIDNFLSQVGRFEQYANCMELEDEPLDLNTLKQKISDEIQNLKDALANIKDVDSTITNGGQC